MYSAELFVFGMFIGLAMGVIVTLVAISAYFDKDRDV